MIQRGILLGNTAFVPTVIGMYRVWTGSLTHEGQATNLWMQEVTNWTKKIAKMLSAGHQARARKIDVGRFQDEIYKTNLWAGIAALRLRGEYFGAWRHFLVNRYPYKADLLSQAKLLVHLLLPLKK